MKGGIEISSGLLAGVLIALIIAVVVFPLINFVTKGWLFYYLAKLIGMIVGAVIDAIGGITGTLANLLGLKEFMMTKLPEIFRPGG